MKTKPRDTYDLDGGDDIPFDNDLYGNGNLSDDVEDYNINLMRNDKCSRTSQVGVLGENTSGETPSYFRDGVVIGPNSTELFSLAGRLGRDANLLPFHFLKWPLVDIEYKNRVMMEIKQHFDFSYECNKHVLKQLNAPWKDEKRDMKREYFTPFATREERIANRPDKVPEDQ
ncbi:Uncharacterized protein Fot_23635 [Forsythia ovata]|uniref:Uncharacterized protein n=1 Tax=Forsythia ovata TaxID=205694 RepID=A0ABD1V146_9LAMI